MSLQNMYPYCDDSRECFGRIKDKRGDGKCTCLTDTYREDGECPFAKPNRAITNDKLYTYHTPSGSQ